jgi:ABC-2 type transport system ATP-binding protein
MDDAKVADRLTRRRPFAADDRSMANTSSDAAAVRTQGSVPPAVCVRGLRKQYQGKFAVDGIDLDIERGEVFALLGPNGAGKTTTVEILEGHRRRDGGEVSVLGVDPAAGDRVWGLDQLRPAAAAARGPRS